MIDADQFVTFFLPEWQYDSTCRVLGKIFRVPDLIGDVCQPPNNIIATSFKHFRRNFADARGSVIFQKLHSLFYLIHGYWIGGALNFIAPSVDTSNYKHYQPQKYFIFEVRQNLK